MIQLGDILVFKRNQRDPVSKVLSWILQRFEGSYDRYGWHTAVVSRVRGEDVWITEAVRPVSRERLLKPSEEYRVYRWLQPPINEPRFKHIARVYLGKRYDFDSYVGTFITYPLTKVFHRPLRFVDDEYHCQELVCAICDDYGEQILKDWQPVVITEMLKVIEPWRVKDD